jgi:hypothetical protein
MLEGKNRLRRIPPFTPVTAAVNTSPGETEAVLNTATLATWLVPNTLFDNKVKVTTLQQRVFNDNLFAIAVATVETAPCVDIVTQYTVYAVAGVNELIVTFTP